MTRRYTAEEMLEMADALDAVADEHTQDGAPQAGQLFAKAAAMLTQVAATEEERGWGPIETAPRDGTRFMAWDDSLGVVLHTVHWGAHGWLTDNERWSGIFSRWMPLPPAPEGP